ncbi:MAG: acylphosphatase [Candidatus Spechtbacteria bacterium]|nr:acylphosphatase [Candidatus Spechtbacteria bacterium]
MRNVPGMKHLNIRVSGRVQGIFYRHSAHKYAEELGIRGFVRNESNGSVYMEVEGEDEAIGKFVEWAGRGPVFAGVDRIETEEKELKNFSEFKIEH